MERELDASDVAKLVASELSSIADRSVADKLRACIVGPTSCLLNWDYGHPHQEFSEPRYPGFIVAEFVKSGTGIAYSKYGSGPRQPWVLIFLATPDFGMDSSWFSTLEDAFRDSMGFDS